MSSVACTSPLAARYFSIIPASVRDSRLRSGLASLNSLIASIALRLACSGVSSPYLPRVALRVRYFLPPVAPVSVTSIWTKKTFEVFPTLSPKPFTLPSPLSQ